MCTALIHVIKEGLSEKIRHEQRLEGGQGGNHLDIWRMSSPGSGNGERKDPEVGLERLKTSKETVWAEWRK